MPYYRPHYGSRRSARPYGLLTGKWSGVKKYCERSPRHEPISTFKGQRSPCRKWRVFSVNTPDVNTFWHILWQTLSTLAMNQVKPCLRQAWKQVGAVWGGRPHDMSALGRRNFHFQMFYDVTTLDCMGADIRNRRWLFLADSNPRIV